MQLILASSSPYRQQLLQRLTQDFECRSPSVDETPLKGESAEALALRLATAKARKIADQHPQAIVIGSDQVAELNGELLGKPGNAETAQRQLQAASGQCVNFYTGLCVINAASGSQQQTIVLCEAQFRKLENAEITRYIEWEQPLDCAGSFKSEGLGISLFEHIHSDDPTSLIGLPLIKTAEFLRNEGLQLP